MENKKISNEEKNKNEKKGITFIGRNIDFSNMFHSFNSHFSKINRTTSSCKQSRMEAGKLIKTVAPERSSALQNYPQISVFSPSTLWKDYLRQPMQRRKCDRATNACTSKNNSIISTGKRLKTNYRINSSVIMNSSHLNGVYQKTFSAEAKQLANPQITYPLDKDWYYSSKYNMGNRFKCKCERDEEYPCCKKVKEWLVILYHNKGIKFDFEKHKKQYSVLSIFINSYRI